MALKDLSIRLSAGLLTVGLLAGCAFDAPPPTRVLGGSDELVITRGIQEEGRQLAVEACRRTDPSSEVELVTTEPTGDICRALGPPWPAKSGCP